MIQIVNAMQKTKIEPYYEYLPDCVICDLDGTLAIDQERGWYDYDEVINDPIDPRLYKHLRFLLRSGVKIMFVTGREDNKICREMTSKWLDKYFIYFDNSQYQLIMRNEADNRPDEEVKKELYEMYIKGQYNVLMVFDDRQVVVDMWRDQGLLCCQVAKGDY